jgi:hypothetical protein
VATATRGKRAVVQQPGCTLVIARPEIAPALRDTLQTDRNVVVVDAADAMHSLPLVSERDGSLVAVERAVLETTAGREFVAQVRDLTRDLNVELRMFSPMDLRKPPRGSARAMIATASQPLAAGVSRRVPRFPMDEGLTTLVKGSTSTLIDLSVMGAQVISASVLRPNERVLMRLLDGEGDLMVKAAIAWSVYEQARVSRVPQYRVGLEFTVADADALERYCREHRRTDENAEQASYAAAG